MLFSYYAFYFQTIVKQALRIRAKKQRAAKKPNLTEYTTGGSVIENVAQTRRLAETTLDSSKSGSRLMPDEAPTNTASGSNEDEDENGGSPDECHVSKTLDVCVLRSIDYKKRRRKTTNNNNHFNFYLTCR